MARPPYIRLIGDREVAEQHIRRAKAELFRTEQLASLENAPIYARTTEVSDHVSIVTQISNGLRIIEITAVPKGEKVHEDRKKKYDRINLRLYHGVAYGHVISDLGEDGYSFSQFRPTEDCYNNLPDDFPSGVAFQNNHRLVTQASSALGWYQCAPFTDIDENLFEISQGAYGYTAGGEFDFEDGWNETGYGEDITLASNQSAGQTHRIRPCQYSGILRQAAAIALGHGNFGLNSAFLTKLGSYVAACGGNSIFVNEAYTSGIRCQYAQEHYRTHGVTVAEDGSHWLVEFSKPFGLLARRLPVFPVYKLVNDEFEVFFLLTEKEIELIVSVFGGIPSGEAFPTDTGEVEAGIESGLFKQLITADQLTEYYSYYPYARSGYSWSFNETGREARTTTWKPTGAKDKFTLCAYWQLQISIKPETDTYSAQIKKLADKIIKPAFTTFHDCEGEHHYDMEMSSLNVYYHEPTIAKSDRVVVNDSRWDNPPFEADWDEQYFQVWNVHNHEGYEDESAMKTVEVGRDATVVWVGRINGEWSEIYHNKSHPYHIFRSLEPPDVSVPADCAGTKSLNGYLTDNLSPPYNTRWIVPDFNYSTEIPEGRDNVEPDLNYKDYHKIHYKAQAVEVSDTTVYTNKTLPYYDRTQEPDTWIYVGEMVQKGNPNGSNPYYFTILDDPGWYVHFHWIGWAKYQIEESRYPLNDVYFYTVPQNRNAYIAVRHKEYAGVYTDVTVAELMAGPSHFAFRAGAPDDYTRFDFVVPTAMTDYFALTASNNCILSTAAEDLLSWRSGNTSYPSPSNQEQRYLHNNPDSVVPEECEGTGHFLSEDEWEGDPIDCGESGSGVSKVTTTVWSLTPLTYDGTITAWTSSGPVTSGGVYMTVQDDGEWYSAGVLPGDCVDGLTSPSTLPILPDVEYYTGGTTTGTATTPRSSVGIEYDPITTPADYEYTTYLVADRLPDNMVDEDGRLELCSFVSTVRFGDTFDFYDIWRGGNAELDHVWCQVSVLGDKAAIYSDFTSSGVLYRTEGQVPTLPGSAEEVRKATFVGITGI